MTSKLINHPGPFAAAHLADMRLRVQQNQSRVADTLRELRDRRVTVAAKLAAATEEPARIGLGAALRGLDSEIAEAQTHFDDHTNALADLDSHVPLPPAA